MKFKIKSRMKPKGDQPAAIAGLVEGLEKGEKYGTLLGVTGSGKTFTIANVIEAVQRPTLVLSHNKTLAAQLYGEFKDLFPDNAVEYFVSYYDYYQPEAYIPRTDTYIEKDSSINEDIDRLRLRATSSLLSRRDCVIVASVSAIYGLGSPTEYAELLVFLKKGDTLPRETLLKKLVDIQYRRSDVAFERGTFRVRGDVVEIFLAYEETAIRVESEWDTVKKISRIRPVTGEVIHALESVAVYPAKHFVTTQPRLERALVEIEKELKERLEELHSQNKLVRARKETLVEYGFRLPSALDNRPLRFEEFESVTRQTIFVSATPSEYEIKRSSRVVEQVIRPTGLLDPPIDIRPTRGQIENLMAEISERAKKKERVLVTTLTKKMAEDLAAFLKEKGVLVQYIHSEIGAIERVEILRDLRLNKFDCLVGINLLREGIDLPEVSLVAVLDADKEGFLRSQTSLIQVAGRAARHANGAVILYADRITDSMRYMIRETDRRRRLQTEFNRKNGITPTSIQKEIREGIEAIKKAREVVREATGLDDEERDVYETISDLEREMEEAAKNLQFERAIELRDQIKKFSSGSLPAGRQGPVERWSH
ncbi:MAG: UvrB/UvrC motif-containing protein [Candidatus Omnitrophica bacterium]|nr:UvrB/UvrC motif-containing protein [Candidatus Omnitrophota bacterium]